ncbi:MAG: tRNA lysidine(34) synthetase TilS, partial [Candidatus Marinimicrobia bacterium]|nr:tRNA lysidine(34) synthetase TilS [Candidatus Neomarinimicrobiota bacterium]
HSNDNIETILMHLNDGCGIEGLRGIPPKNGFIIRPLLKYSRNEIQVYIHNHKFKYYEDESNSDVSIIRNNIRHSLVKPWENQTDQFIDRFNDLSHKAINAVNRMNDLIAELSKRVENVNHQKLIHDQLVEKLLPSQLVRLVKHLIGETEISWRRHQWDGLEQWLKKSKIGSKLKLNSHWTILRDRNSWILSNKVHDAISLLIKSQGEFSTDGFSLYLNKIEKPTLNSQNSKEVIDAKIIEGKRLNLRSWRHGDVFQPLGMPGHKKVSDLLVDEKVDRFSKEKQLVLTANDEIIWVCGRRLSEKAKITNSTQEFLELSMKTKVGVSWT